MNEWTLRSRFSAALPRFRWFGLVVAVALAFTGGLAAQVVRDNVNIMNPAPGSFQGDIFERQVETDIAVSPVNSGRAMAGFITYQTLDAALGASSWCGYSVTNNGGKTWKSNLLPGFPQSGQTASPLWGLAQCVDPVLAAAPPGDASPAHIYYGGMGMTKGLMTKVFVSTFDDRDDQNGDLIYRNMVVVDSGNYSFQGQVLDKPAITVDPPSPGYPQGIVHFTYVVFNGNSDADFRTKVLYVRSTDGGLTFSRPVKLNGTFNKNNGTAIARRTDGTMFVFWRTFLEENGIQVVSIDRAGNVSKPVTVAGGPSFYAYDQFASPVTFRSTAFPTAVADAGGQLYVAWQECVTSSGSPAPCTAGIGPRIVLSKSTDGQIWTPQRKAVEVGPPNAHQFQPDLSAGGGVVSLLFWDARRDGRPLVGGYFAGLDRRMEMRVAQAVNGGPFNASVDVSKYPTYADGQLTGQNMPRPGYTKNNWEQCKAGNQLWTCLAVNLPNLPSTSNGAVAFFGDYVGIVSAVEFKRDNGVWRLALQPWDLDARTFYAVFPDTRLVAFPGSPSTPNINGTWTSYTPGGNCFNPGTRNTKPFFATVSPGVVARWSGTSRPLQGASNAFTVTVENQTGLDKYFRITILDNKLAGQDWSFVQPPATMDSNGVDLQILRHSAFTRGVYYRGAGTPISPVVVNVVEISNGVPLLDGLKTSVTVNMCALLGSWCTSLGSPTYGLTVDSQSVKNLPSGVKANSLQPHYFGFENFGFENFGFENFGFENFGFENFGFENFGFENSPPGDYDVSWTVSGQGLLPTSGNTFVAVDGAQNILNSTTPIGGVQRPNYMFRLFVYQTHSTPALNFSSSGGCPARVDLLQDQLISSIPIAKTNESQQLVGAFGFENFGFENFGFENFGFENSPPSDITNGAFVAGADGVKLTLRSYKRSGAPPLYTPGPTNGVVSQGIVPQALNPGQTTRSGSFDDTTPPVITAVVSPPPNAAGWNNSDVTVTWSVGDPGSGITSQTGCGTSTIIAEGQTTVGPCRAVNGKVLSASNSVTIKIDRTPPTIITSRTPGPNPAGWNNTDVTVTFTCSDALSGVAPPSLTQQVVSTEGAEQFRTGTCFDVAGNSASATVSGINIDKTAPTATFGALSPAANVNGWNNTDVLMSFTTKDDRSGVALSAPASPLLLTAEGAAVTGSVMVTDVAGNSATYLSPPVKIDRTLPTLAYTASANGGPYTLGAWTNKDVKVEFVCTDVLSGVFTPPVSPQLVTSEGVNQSVTGTCADKAGNLANLPVGPINIDKTNPIVKSITVPAEGNSYLLNANVASSFACEDALSGMASCTGPALVPTSTLGENTFTVTATDKAGNIAPKTVKYSVVYKFILTPPKSDANLGSAVPLIWQLTDANGTVIISDLGSLKSLTSYAPLVPGACGSGTPALLYSPAGGATGGSGFRFSGTTFQINWDTSTAVGTGPGCYTLEWTFNDNSKQRTNIVLR